MNLYEIKFVHYAPKDNRSGIREYLVAENDEQIYDYLGFAGQFDGYDYTKEEQELIKRQIIESTDEEAHNWFSLSDLYYGKTTYYWDKVFDDIKEEDINKLEELRINIERVGD